MRLDAATRIIQYVGHDQHAWDALRRSFAEPAYRLEHVRGDSSRWQSLDPSWCCGCVVVIDHVEEADTANFMEELARHDAGIPMIALVDGEHPARLTAAGLARLHGVHRLVVKPWSEPSGLIAAVESGFDWLDHWKQYLQQALALSCGSVHLPRRATPALSLRPEPTVTSAASTASF
jgi:hypothetical protein